MTKPAQDQLSGRGSTFSRHAVALSATGMLAATIAYLTLTPPRPDAASFLSDKVYHFIAFGALVFPAALLCARSLVWVLPAALVFGGAIELIQPYVGRSREVTDFVAGILGSGGGVALGLAIRAVRFKRARTRQTAASQI